MKALVRLRPWTRALSVVLLCIGAPAAALADAAADAALEAKILDVIRQHPKEIIEAVAGYQRQQAEARMRSAEEQLRARVEKLDRTELLGDSPARGGPDGKLVLVEFSDFQCPYCKRAFKTVQNFMQAHGNEVRLVYKHLPLSDMHPEAGNAALAAWAAHQQGKFWEYHDKLFAAPEQLGEAYYVGVAKDLGLDIKKFDQDRNSAAARQAIDADVGLAGRLGIDATPQFLLNGLPITGAAPPEEFEKALARAKADMAN